ncbi:hypothetical protein Tco_1167502 [Tanacetum coccineum]
MPHQWRLASHRLPPGGGADMFDCSTRLGVVANHCTRWLANERLPRVCGDSWYSLAECICTRSFTSKLVVPFSDPESVIRNRQRNLGEPSLLFDFEEINMSNDLNINHGPPPAGLPPQNQDCPPGPNLQNLAPDLRMMEELC